MERGPGNHLEFKLNCSSKFWEDEGAHIPEEHRILEKPEFEYIIFDRERNLALTTKDYFDLDFQLINWKWLSEPVSHPFQINSID